MDNVTRRRFIGTVAAAGTVAAFSPRDLVAAEEPGFRGTLCFFSKHLPRHDARGLVRALKPLGFAGVDLTVRPKGHIDPSRVVQDLPPFVAAIRDEGLAVPMITTDLKSDADPAARPTFETAASLRIPYLKPGYYSYAFVDVRKERDNVGSQLRSLAAIAARTGVQIGFHNHDGNVGGGVWDIVPIIDTLDPKAIGYYFDPRHAVAEGGSAGWRSAFNVVAPRLSMIALKDFVWEKSGAGWRIQNVPMGQGMVNWKVFFSMLAKTDFRGPVSLHVEYAVPGATPEAIDQNMLTAAAQDLAFIKKQLAEAYAAPTAKL
jgi:sugar phosphate isomerase/epimerase